MFEVDQDPNLVAGVALDGRIARMTRSTDVGIHRFLRLDARRPIAELVTALTFVLDLLADYGLHDYYLELSTRPEGKAVGTDEEIAEFCASEYSVTFPVMAKITVKGE